MKEDIKTARFDNGLTVLTDRMEGVRSVTLGFFFRKGARHEPAELNGISHFIEHTVFKGTGRRSALEIAIEQDRLGGNLDAFTTHEETGFAIKVIDDQLDAAFDLLADMLSNPSFDEAELESEQRVILEEMKMIDDSPEEYLSDIFHQEFFPGHPLGLTISGTPKTVRSFSADRTREYHAGSFNAANLIITAAGNVRHEHVVELAERYWDLNAPGTAAIDESLPTTASPILIRQKPDLEQAHLLIATPLVGARDMRRYAADLLANVIGGGTSSRLWQKIREQRGLAYNVGSSAVMFHDCGFFSIFAGTSPEQTEEVLKLSLEEMRAVVRNGITGEELELAKQQTVSSILLGLEDSAARAATLAHSEMLHGRQIPVDETIRNIMAVGVDDAVDIAREFFRTESVAVAALGDLNGFTVDRNSFDL